MKNIFTLPLLLLLIIGCATPADRRNNIPDITTSSKKTTKEVAICIADKWENTKPFMALSSPQVNTSLKSSGFSVTVTDISSWGTTYTIALADIKENHRESTTHYYKMSGGGLGDYDIAIKECQQ